MGERLTVLREVKVLAKCEGHTARVPLLVVEGNSPIKSPGKGLVEKFKLNWSRLLNIQVCPEDYRQVIERYAEVLRRS